MAKMTKERKNLSIGLIVFTVVVIATAVMGIVLLKPSTEYIEGQSRRGGVSRFEQSAVAHRAFPCGGRRYRTCRRYARDS